MPLWNFRVYAVSRWKSQDDLQILVLFPLCHGCLSRCTRSGNCKVRKRIRRSDQEVTLPGTESKEDPHPLDGNHYVQEIYREQVIISSSQRRVTSKFMASYLIRKHSPKCHLKKMTFWWHFPQKEEIFKNFDTWPCIKLFFLPYFGLLFPSIYRWVNSGS